MPKSRSEPGVYQRGRVWWIRYTDHTGRQVRKSGSTDKSAALKLLGDALKAVEQMRAGMVHANPLEARRPIGEHVAAYIENLHRLGRDAMYVYTIERRLSRAIKERRWTRLRDCTPASVTAHLSELARGRTPKGKTEPVPRSPKTVNDVRADLAAFFGWCVAQGRMEANPCTAVAPAADKHEKKRRALSVPEVRALLAATPEPRRLTYLFLTYTGVRRSEAAALRWGYLHLDGVNRYVELPASITKSGRPEAVPLVDELADALLVARDNAGDGEPVFAEIPDMGTFRADLDAAGIEEVDERGRKVVLHSLRHSLATMLAASGVPLAVAQRVMRHRDIRLTAEVYTDEGLLPLASGMKALPSLAPSGPTREPLTATGTDDAAPQPRPGPLRLARGPAGDCAKSVLDGRHCAAQPGTSVREEPVGDSTEKHAKSGFGAPDSYLLLGGETGDLGFEPRLTDPESVVLPLHQSPSAGRLCGPDG